MYEIYREDGRVRNDDKVRSYIEKARGDGHNKHYEKVYREIEKSITYKLETHRRRKFIFCLHNRRKQFLIVLIVKRREST